MNNHTRHKPVIIVFQDLKVDKRHCYQFYSWQPSTHVIKEQIYPGDGSFPPMYIRHIEIDEGLLVTQTDYELDEAKRQEIIEGAKNALKSRRRRFGKGAFN